MLQIKRIILVALAFSALSVSAVKASDQIDHSSWDLSHLYPNDTAWLLEYSETSDMLNTPPPIIMESTQSAVNLLTALDTVSTLKRKTAKLYTYAALSYDVDLRSDEARARWRDAYALHQKTNALTAIVSQKIRSLDQAQLNSWISKQEGLKVHTFPIQKMLRSRSTTTNHAPEHQEFQRLQEDIQWPVVTLSDGQIAVITPAGYTYYRALNNPNDRIRVFDAYWGTIHHNRNAFAKALQAHILRQTAASQALGFNSSLEASLWHENIPTSVYDTLLTAGRRGLPSLHRYLNLKKRILGSDLFSYSDIYAPTTPPPDPFTLKDAKALSARTLAIFGANYIDILQTGFKGDWMHSAPLQGKRSGAYMQDAAYGVHPYILLNFTGRYKDVGTFIHEWGHAVHSVFAQQHNPYETARYSSLTAELTALTNEVLLHHHMIQTATSPKEKLYYIMEELELFRASFFHYVLLADFEQRLHNHLATGEHLSADQVTDLYLELLSHYYGGPNTTEISKIYALEWAVSPHLYNSFSIYQQAVGIAGATQVASRLLRGKTGAKEPFIHLLKAGGSNYPHDLLVEAGIDLTSQTPYEALIQHMNVLIDQAEQAFSEIKH